MTRFGLLTFDPESDKIILGSMPEETFLNLAELLGVQEEPSVQQLALYIPDKNRHGDKIDNLEGWIEEAKKILSVIGGSGATAMPPADGSWLKFESRALDADAVTEQDLLFEKTIIIYSYIEPEKFMKNLQPLREFLHRFGRETDQGEVVFEFDLKFYKISKYDEAK